MRTGLTKREKTTAIYFDEYGSMIEVQTHNTDLKKRLSAFAAKYPECCRQIDDNEQGGLTFEIEKGRLSFRLTAPYSEERRQFAKERAIKQLLNGSNWYAPNKADRKITLGVNTGWANEKKLLLRKKSRWWRNILQDGCVCGKRRVGPEWGTPPWRVGSAGIARREFRHWRRMGIAPNGSTARTSSAKWRRSTCPVRAVPWPSRKSIICAPGIWYWTG